MRIEKRPLVVLGSTVLVAIASFLLGHLGGDKARSAEVSHPVHTQPREVTMPPVRGSGEVDPQDRESKDAYGAEQAEEDSPVDLVAALSQETIENIRKKGLSVEDYAVLHDSEQRLAKLKTESIYYQTRQCWEAVEWDSDKFLGAYVLPEVTLDVDETQRAEAIEALNELKSRVRDEYTEVARQHGLHPGERRTVTYAQAAEGSKTQVSIVPTLDARARQMRSDCEIALHAALGPPKGKGFLPIRPAMRLAYRVSEPVVTEYGQDGASEEEEE